MKRLTSTLLLLVLVSLPVFAGNWWPRPEPDQVISDDQIREHGCMRLSDVLMLIDDWDIFSIDGYTWETNAAGLSTMVHSDFLVLVDGQPVHMRYANRWNLNRLPIALSRIDRINVYNRPVLLAGTSAPHGAIEILTDDPDHGINYRGSVMHGSVTGSPGPWRYMPNNEDPEKGVVADDLTNGGSIAYGKFYVAGDYRTTRHYLVDEDLVQRDEAVNDLKSGVGSTDGYFGEAGFAIGPVTLTGVGYGLDENAVQNTSWEPLGFRYDNSFGVGSGTMDLELTDNLGVVIRAEQSSVRSNLTDWIVSKQSFDRESYNAAIRGRFRAFHTEVGHRLTSVGHNYYNGLDLEATTTSQLGTILDEGRTLADTDILDSDEFLETWHERQSYFSGFLDLHDLTLESHAVYITDTKENAALTWGSWMSYRIDKRWSVSSGMSHATVFLNSITETPFSGGQDIYDTEDSFNFERFDAEATGRLPYRIQLNIRGSIQNDENVRSGFYSTPSIPPYFTYRVYSRGTLGLLSIKLYQRVTDRISYRVASRWSRVMDGDGYYTRTRKLTSPLLVHGSILYDTRNHLTVVFSGSFRRWDNTASDLGFIYFTNNETGIRDLVSFDLALSKSFWKNHVRATLDLRNLTGRELRYSGRGSSVYDRSYWLKVDILMPSHEFF